MQFRKIGPRVPESVSALGFGCMRFPTLGEPDKIDTDQATRMIHRAIDRGVNYFDTAWPYHKGASEPFLGDVLAHGLRSEVLVATKMPMWAVNEADDLDKYLSLQLERLQTDHIDFYLLHSLNKDFWERVQRTKALEWGERQKAQGRIRYFGFSFHDELPLFKKIIDAHEWDFCQIQYNYMNETFQAGSDGLRYAASRDVGVVVMEPLLGGSLADQPDALGRIWAQADSERSSAEWALQWLWDKPEVGTVLSGMSTLEQVEENTAAAERSRVGVLTVNDRVLFNEAKNAYGERRPVPCTKCRYCMPCPNGVDIPRNFDAYNVSAMYDNWGHGRWVYNHAIPEEARADACIACGECVPKCPQGIEIIDALAETHEKLKPVEAS